jgi:polyhydroxyalkanoate synthesis repressor PhaR
MTIIKRYSNRKLYDTTRRRYISLDDIAELVRADEEVRIIDHQDGQDITTLVLFQVVIHEEKRIGGLLPEVLLTRLIRFGADALDNLKAMLARAAQTYNSCTVIDREIERRLRHLVRTGELSPQEGLRLNKLLITGFEWELDTRQQVLNADIPDSPSELVQQLLSQLDRLEAELEELRFTA